MVSRYGSTSGTPTPTTTTQTQVQSGGTTVQDMNQTQQSSESYNRMNIDPASMQALQALIQQLGQGGTPEQQAEAARRGQAISQVQQMLQMVSPGQARTDAEAMMALNLQQALERNMPAIAKAIEGAGTSASSAQASLSTRMARDAALAAGALGADQMRAYAGERSNLASVLEALTRQQGQGTRALIDALSLARGATESGTRSGTVNTSGTTTTTTPDTRISTISSTAPTDSFGSGGGSTYGGTDYGYGVTGFGPVDSGGGGGYDPNTYYSSLGRSGSGQSLSEFLLSQ